jgi:transposase
MPRRIKREAHLGTDELEQAYRRAKDGVARSQWHMLWLLSSGKSSAEVAALTGYCVDWIRKVARRYNAQGIAGVGDRRHANPGRERLLDSRQEAALGQQLTQAEAAGQHWNSVQVAAWMSAQLGYRVRAERGRDVLQRLEYSTKTPRPRHAKAEPAEQDAFKKKPA